MKKKVIFYLIDGARPDVLKREIDKGELPNIKAYLTQDGHFEVGSTCFPSTTGPAYLPFLTGRHPADHHITGIRWFDKQEFLRSRWSRNSMRSYVGYEAKYFNDDMDPQYPSLLETIPDSYNIYNMITKGVTQDHDLARKGKSGLYFRAHFMHKHHVVDHLGHEKLMMALDKDPTFVFSVFPSIDWDSHSYHYEDPRTLEAYKIADHSLGEVIAKLKKKNAYKSTRIIMVSDHGLSSTHTHFDLGKFFKRHSYRVLEYPSILTIKPQVAVFISGNSFASLFFLDQSTPYLANEIWDKHGEVTRELIAHESIDFLIMKLSENQYRIQNQDGYALVTVDHDLYSYIPETADPLHYGQASFSLPYHQTLEHSINGEYPDALVQCHTLIQSHRAGDVLVCAKNGYDLRDFWEIPEHRGSHGSLHWEHMRVPLLSNHHIFKKSERTTSIYHHINDWLN